MEEPLVTQPGNDKTQAINQPMSDGDVTVKKSDKKSLCVAMVTVVLSIPAIIGA